MVIVPVAIDTVYKQMVAIPLEKRGNRDPFASRSLAAFARHVRHPVKTTPQMTRFRDVQQAIIMATV